MQGFTYLCFISQTKPQLRIEFKNLIHTEQILNFDYLQILQNQGIKINEVIQVSQSSDLKIQLEKAKTPLFYKFTKGNLATLITVSNSFLSDEQGNLIHLLDDFELLVQENYNFFYKELEKFDNKESQSIEIQDRFNEQEKSKLEREEQEELPQLKEKTIELLAKNLSNLILHDFLIPQKSFFNDENLDDILPSSNNRDLYQKIDTSWTIEEHIDYINKDKSEFKELLFKLWIYDRIQFRIKFYPWDRFQQTVKASLYLHSGTSENLNLIQMYNSSKIIKMLEFIGEGISYTKLIQTFKTMTQTKINLYIEELLNQKIIRKIPFIPKLDHISEDLIPLLIMQGFSKSDFQVLHKLENIINNEKSLDEISLEIGIEPSRIKSLLAKYQTSIRVLL